MPTYYTYEEPYPTALQDPYSSKWENAADWPKTYRYVSSQGIHPPAPVYQNNQPAPPPSYYYNGGQQFAPQFQSQYPTPYYGNGNYLLPQTDGLYTSPYSPHCYFPYPYTSSWYSTYHPSLSYTYSPFVSQIAAPAQMPFYAVPGQPMAMPQPMCPASLTAQAAAAAAANATLAQMPNGPAYYVGTGPMDFAAQQAILAAQMGMPAAPPSSLAPYKPSDGQQFWCKELDGSWTLRTYSDIALGEVAPGHWERHAVSGYFFWVRQAQ